MSSQISRTRLEDIASAHPEVEFALVLSRTIDSLTKDPEQLRAAVYELAREKLTQLSNDDPEKDRLMGALEVAIAGVETHANKYPVERLALSPPSNSLAAPLPNHAIAAPGALPGITASEISGL